MFCDSSIRHGELFQDAGLKFLPLKHMLTWRHNHIEINGLQVFFIFEGVLMEKKEIVS